jgi:hypothetical protein
MTDETNFTDKKIIIHSYSYGPDYDRHFQITDITISLYYVSKDFIESEKDFYSVEYVKEKGYIKEGYIIEAKIKAVKKSIVKYITENYFKKIYKEFEKINFEELARENSAGCDGWGLEIEVGTYKGLTEYVKRLVLWSPLVSENDKQSDLYKLLNIIDNIKMKIKFNEWYNKNYKEWEKWEEKLENYYNTFEYSKD